MSSHKERFIPRFSRWGKPFWEGAKRHELMIQECSDCGYKNYPPTLYCPRCLSSNLKWVKASGKGRVHSYTVVYEYPPPGFKTPYIIALIDLEEGVRMLSNIVDCSPEDVKIGMPVEVAFIDVTEDFTLPVFRPLKEER
jgi:uncharacterized OB-fold protein